MKRKKVLRQAAALIPNARWHVYAMAGAATALTGAHSAEGNIVYSGLLDVAFNETSKAFQLDMPGNSINFAHLIRTGTSTVGTARFAARGGVSAAFRGFPSYGGGYGYVSKLNFGQKISAGPFWDKFGTMVFSGGREAFNAQWLDGGTGFVGFTFNSGAGAQYGWARVTFDDAEVPPNGLRYNFTLNDYAFGSVGDQVKAGQVPDSGSSLGLLALGAAGILACRRFRAKAAAE